MPTIVNATPTTVRTPPGIAIHRLRPSWGGSGRSRIARMTLSRDMKNDVTTTVNRATTKPNMKPACRLRRVTANCRLSVDRPPPAWLKIREVAVITSRPMPTPTSIPANADTRVYSHPSSENEPTKLARRSPTARNMPRVCFRSWASITKMLISSKTPTATLK